MPLCLAIIGTWEATSETILNASTSWEVLICLWVGVFKNKQGKATKMRNASSTNLGEKQKLLGAFCGEYFRKGKKNF